MSRPIPTFALLTALLVFGTASASAQDLFSQGDLQGVFGQQRVQQPQAPSKLTAPGIPLLLQEAGLQPEKINETVSRVKVAEGEWTFPVAVFLSKDQSQLWLVFLLDKVTPETSRTQLMSLMKLSSEFGPAHFVVSNDNDMIYLQRNLDNKGITADMIRRELDYMKRLADKGSKFWSSQSSSTPQTPQTPAHIGFFRAQVGEMMTVALQIEANGTFKMIVTQNGQDKTSVGRYTLNGNQLTFNASDGEVLSGTITMIQNGFTFQMNGGQGASIQFARI